MKHILSAALLSLLISPAFAQDNSENNSQEKWLNSSGWGVSLGSISIDPVVAAEGNIGDSAQYISGYWQGQHDNFLMATGFGFLILDDKLDVSYTTEDQFGNVEDSSASASGIDFYFEGGYRYNVAKFNFDILAGYEYMSADRSVSNCSDCPSDDITLEAGLYVKPRIGVAVNSKWSVEMSYVAYTAADIESNLGFSATYTY